MQINYKVLPTFMQVHKDRNPYIFVMGPVGSGKSSGCIFHAVFNGMRQKPDENGVRHYRHLIVRATYPALKSTVIPTMRTWFRDKLTIVYDTPIRGYLKYPLSDGTVLDMEFFFIAVDTEASVEKLRSLEVSSAHINEASEISKHAFDIISSRTNRYPAQKDGGCLYPFIICDYNAISTEHWIYKLVEETRPEGVSFYRQPPAVIKVNDKYHVNPDADNLCNVKEIYYKNMLITAEEDFIIVNLMNNYGEVRRGRPVYKDYSDKAHFVEETLKPLRGVPVVIGVDQGLTPAACFTQLQHDGELLVFDEITTTDCSLQEFANEHLWPLIHTKYPWIIDNFMVVCDPATNARSMNDAKSGLQILKETGLPVKLARSNVFTERREAVVHFLRTRDKFRISKDCPVLRRGFISEYKYDESKTVNGILYKEKPAKNEYSHIHDALQYAAMQFYHNKTKSMRDRFAQIKPRRYSAASSIGGY